MNRKSIKILVLFLLVMIVIILYPYSIKANRLSPIDGTFFPAHLAVDFTEEQWANELAEWDEMGIEYVVIGESAIRNGDGKWETYYPSQYSDIYYHNSVETILQYCESAGVKCFIACGNYYDFHSINLCRYNEYDADGNLVVRGQEYFEQLVYDTHRYMQELYDLYGSKYPNSFYGFYFVPEVSNSVDFEQDELLNIGVESLSNALNLTIDKVNQLNPNLKLLLSPYANLKSESSSWNTHNMDVIEKFWTNVIQKTNFRDGDILSPQDSVGANGVKLSELEAITKAYYNAVAAGGKNIELWSNCETFLFPLETMNVPYETGQSTFIDRLIQQTDIVKPYVDKIISCSYTNYIGRSNCGDSFYRTYRDYLLTGQLDRIPPNPIDMVTGDVIVVNNEPVLHLTCSPISDFYGVARMEVKKNHDPFTFRVATRYEKNPTDFKPGIAPPSSFYDEDFVLHGGSATYSVILYDCAGNANQEVSVFVSSSLISQQELGIPYSTEYTILNSATYEIQCTLLDFVYNFDYQVLQPYQQSGK
jgi:hypothetical protein